MNTVEKGDNFELLCHNLIVAAIEDEKFAFPLKYAHVKRKAKYYSKTREKEIIFDLSIEIWPPGASNYSMIYIIECKSYSTKKVPIGDLNKFAYDVNDVAQLNGKAVFITSSSYTDTALTTAKNTGMMLIQVEENNSMSILLQKRNRLKSIEQDKQQSKQFEKFIKNIFKPVKVQGLKKLNSMQIEKKAAEFLIDFNPYILTNYEGYDFDELIQHLEEKLSIMVIYKNLNCSDDDIFALGNYNNQEKVISIDLSIRGSKRMGFVLAHEIGHAVLHGDIRINNELYYEFSDSEYDLVSDKHLLTNYKHWIEWQANKFASQILVPSLCLKYHLVFKQLELGISKYGHIYLDNQPINRKDFGEIMNYLTFQFNTTKTTIEIRLQELNMITYDDREISERRATRNVHFDY